LSQIPAKKTPELGTGDEYFPILKSLFGSLAYKVCQRSFFSFSGTTWNLNPLSTFQAWLSRALWWHCAGSYSRIPVQCQGPAGMDKKGAQVVDVFFLALVSLQCVLLRSKYLTQQLLDTRMAQL
jgi:hypothetical protein